MCGQLGQYHWKMSRADYLDSVKELEHLQAILDEIPPTKSYHTPIGKKCWIITMEEPSKMSEAFFGYYQKDYKGENRWCFNIRCEGYPNNYHDDPDFRGPYKIYDNPYGAEQIWKRRCVVPVNFFVEQPLGKMKVKPKFIIRKKSPDNSFPVFFLGALYDYIVDTETGEQLIGFSLITTPQSKLLEAIPHPRSPLVVPNHRVLDFLDAELPKEKLEEFFAPFDPATFEMYEVDPVIAKKNLPVAEDDEKLIQPISEIIPG